MKNTPDDFELRQRAEEKLKEKTNGSKQLSGLSSEKMAKPTRYKRRCADCCYGNICEQVI